MSIINRRKFFNKVSIGAIGAAFLSAFPLNLLGKNKSENFSKIEVKIHPNSVKRNN